MASAPQANTPANSAVPESLQFYDSSNPQDLYRQVDLPDGPNPDWICPETEFDSPTNFSDCEPGFDFTGTASAETQATTFQASNSNTKYIRPLRIEETSATSTSCDE